MRRASPAVGANACASPVQPSRSSRWGQSVGSRDEVVDAATRRTFSWRRFEHGRRSTLNVAAAEGVSLLIAIELRHRRICDIRRDLRVAEAVEREARARGPDGLIVGEHPLGRSPCAVRSEPCVWRRAVGFEDLGVADRRPRCACASPGRGVGRSRRCSVRRRERPQVPSGRRIGRHRQRRDPIRTGGPTSAAPRPPWIEVGTVATGTPGRSRRSPAEVPARRGHSRRSMSAAVVQVGRADLPARRAPGHRRWRSSPGRALVDARPRAGAMSADDPSP